MILSIHVCVSPKEVVIFSLLCFIHVSDPYLHYKLNPFDVLHFQESLLCCYSLKILPSMGAIEDQTNATSFFSLLNGDSSAREAFYKRLAQCDDI